MKLYSYVASANAWKAEVAIAQLGLRCERIEVPIFSGGTGDAAGTDGLGNHRVPVLVLDDGTRLPESNAILWHLARGTHLAPETPDAQSQALAWMFFEQNEIEPMIGSARFWRLTGRERTRADETLRRIEAGRKAIAKLDQHLRGKDWLVGARYSIADIAVYAYTHLAGDIGIDLAREAPNVARWCANVEAQPGWFAGPGPYTPDAMV